MMLAQSNKINTSNALKNSVFAQFEQFYSCALFKNSKQLCELEALNTQIEWCDHEKLLDESSDIHDLCCDWSGFRRML